MGFLDLLTGGSYAPLYNLGGDSQGSLFSFPTGGASSGISFAPANPATGLGFQPVGAGDVFFPPLRQVKSEQTAQDLLAGAAGKPPKKPTPPAPTPAGTTGNALYDQASGAASLAGVDPALYAALLQQESGGQHYSAPGVVKTSPRGALGIAQLMPDTAAGLGVDPNNETQNLQGGARYLRQQLDRYGGDIDKTLAAYNAGPGAVDQYGGVPPYPETQSYIQKVRQNLAFYQQQAAAVQPQPGGSPDKVQRFLANADQYVGKPYVWAATGPNSFDCSGLVLYMAQQAGMPFTPGIRTADQIRNVSTPVPTGQAQPGDLVFFHNTDGANAGEIASHVGIVTQHGVMLSAQSEATGVQYANFNTNSYWSSHYLDVRRPPQLAQ